LSAPRRLAGFKPVHLLVLVAVAELSIFRLAEPVLKPKPKAPIPLWFTALHDVGLFLLYFGTMLAVGILVVRAMERKPGQPMSEVIQRYSVETFGFGAALAAIVTVLVHPSVMESVFLQVMVALAILAIVARAWIRRDDLGVTIGVSLVAMPLLVHYATYVYGHLVLGQEAVHDGSLIEHAHDWGLLALVGAAMLTPYALCPKPAIRAVTRLGPIIAALVVGGVGAVLVRREYKAALDLASLGAGIDLGPGVSNNDMALYLLAMATLAWTLTATATAESEARREVGLGFGLVVLGGYGFAWPLHFLLPIIGLLVMVEASPRLAEEEAPRGVRPRTPPIDDDVWAAWIGQLAAALRTDDGAEIRTVTVRGDDQTMQTVMAGERNGVPFKARFGRMGHGGTASLVAIDVVAGREVAETMRATFTLYAKPEGIADAHPSPPPAAPSVNIEDPPFMARFRVRGDAGAVTALLDDTLRARAAAMLDGWLAWWQGSSARLRVYPAVGAPMDHPVPIGDLAVRGAGTVERMSGVIDLVTTIAARGLAAPMPAPAVLE
jgi:hypothetical protein